jgi:adenine C2-methylase RlmN of 23S rRNA A2503 and tRNA A37
MQVPKPLREQLVAAGITTGRSRSHDCVVATDGTRKLLRQLADGRIVETVGIPAVDIGNARLTACVSSQVCWGAQLSYRRRSLSSSLAPLALFPVFG